MRSRRMRVSDVLEAMRKAERDAEQDRFDTAYIASMEQGATVPAATAEAERRLLRGKL